MTPPPTTFTFGENGGYLLSCGRTYKSHNLPPKVQSILNTADVFQIQHAALGARNAFFLSYIDSAGRPAMEWDGVPTKLNAWLDAKDGGGGQMRDVLRVRIALEGRNFWATDGRDAVWEAPAALDAVLKRQLQLGERLRIVAMGAGGSHVAVSERDVAMWEMADGMYGELRMLMGEWSRDQDLGGPGFTIVKDIYLNPHKKNHAIVVFTSGSLTSTGTPSDAVDDMHLIQSAMSQPTQRPAGIHRKPVNGANVAALRQTSQPVPRPMSTPPQSRPDSMPQPRSDWAKFFHAIDNTPSAPVELEGSTPLATPAAHTPDYSLPQPLPPPGQPSPPRPHRSPNPQRDGYFPRPPSLSSQDSSPPQQPLPNPQRDSYFFPASYRNPHGVLPSSASAASSRSSPGLSFRSLPASPGVPLPTFTSAGPKLHKGSARARPEQLEAAGGQPLNPTHVYSAARPANAAKQAYEATLAHMRATQGQLPGGVASATTSAHAHFGAPGSAKPPKPISAGKARYEAEMAAARARQQQQQQQQPPPPQRR